MKLLQFVETFGSLIAFGCVLLYLYQGGYLALGLLLAEFLLANLVLKRIP